MAGQQKVTKREVLAALGVDDGSRIKSEKEILTKILNEQKEDMLRFEIDDDLFFYLAVKDPKNKQHLLQKGENEVVLRKKRKIVDIITKKLKEIERRELEAIN